MALTKQDMENYILKVIQEVNTNNLTVSQFIGYYTFYNNCKTMGVEQAQELGKSLINAQVLLTDGLDNERIGQIVEELKKDLDNERKM